MMKKIHLYGSVISLSLLLFACGWVEDQLPSSWNQTNKTGTTSENPKKQKRLFSVSEKEDNANSTDDDIATQKQGLLFRSKDGLEAPDETEKENQATIPEGESVKENDGDNKSRGFFGIGKKNKKSQEEPQSFTEGSDAQPPLVPWSGQGIAANTFIEISKRADLGTVNIGTTKIMQRRQSPFNMGPQGQGSPFEDFFGDDLFKHFFGGPGGGRGNGSEPQKEFKQQSLGSGFIISEDGLIVTNNHVIDQADEITVTIGKDTDYKAKVIGTDPKTDVALIKIEPKEKLYPLALGDSETLQVGEIVVAIGNPFGLSHTVTQGIVSAKERNIGFGPYDNFIQTDASINRGNSGGPLLNLNAEVVGINTAIHASAQGIGFAIPINLAKNIIPQLEKDGEVTRGWLGVYIQPIEEKVAESLGLSKAKGALVVRVEKDSPADKAGIEAGDVILKVEGREIKDSGDLPKIIANIAVGEDANVLVMRNRQRKRLKVSIGKLQDSEKQKPDASQSDVENNKLGIVVGAITDQDRKRARLDEGFEGVVIRSVSSQSPAVGRGLKEGDVLFELNQQRVANLKDYERVIKGMKEKFPVMIKVVQEGGGRLFVVFSLE